MCRSQPMMIPADHCYPASRGRDVVVILYAQLGTRLFNDWHSLLVKQVDMGHITYILRHYVAAVSCVLRITARIIRLNV